MIFLYILFCFSQFNLLRGVQESDSKEFQKGMTFAGGRWCPQVRYDSPLSDEYVLILLV